MNEACITGASPTQHCGAAACCEESYDCCAACPLTCNMRCGWMENQEVPNET